MSSEEHPVEEQHLENWAETATLRAHDAGDKLNHKLQTFSDDTSHTYYSVKNQMMRLWDLFQRIWQQYSSFRIGGYLFVALISVPLLVFLTFAGGSLVTLTMIAGTFATTIQLGVLAMCGAVLLPVVGAALLASFLASSSYFGATTMVRLSTPIGYKVVQFVPGLRRRASQDMNAIRTGVQKAEDQKHPDGAMNGHD
ncbi:uncharacterized protein BYT42DRAFT_564006 [Radiomyces spectabilis]|uniref:uncharacterized protein n=1 Tax=Radiomyces spectabilis TaxID=64574 RepID=UPI00221E64F5|nr:uncharacterized protein BYT42DRAFT_564006 [Radiomyces spectabilis]KAI8384902.1 hypothetical protein BYT42DRAFT_564006 [Radiomyces spectabilis]